MMMLLVEVGGAERDRTAGLLVANEALSQLSYSPTPIDLYILPAFSFLRHALPDGGVRLKPIIFQSTNRAVFGPGAAPGAGR